MAKFWCNACQDWIEKEDYDQPIQEAKEMHKPRCVVTFNIFTDHPELNALDKELEAYYGEA